MNNYWDSFYDKVTWNEEEEAYFLQRFYEKEGQKINEHIPHSEGGYAVPIPIIAKGLTAYLGGEKISFRVALNEGARIPTVEAFERYFKECMDKLEDKNKKIPLPKNQKTYPELIKKHLDSEVIWYAQSSPFYEEIKEYEKGTIYKIKEVVTYYPDWLYNKLIKPNKLNTEGEKSTFLDIFDFGNPTIFTKHNTPEVLTNSSNVKEEDRQVDIDNEQVRSAYEELHKQVKFSRNDANWINLKSIIGKCEEKMTENKIKRKGHLSALYSIIYNYRFEDKNMFKSGTTFKKVKELLDVILQVDSGTFNRENKLKVYKEEVKIKHPWIENL